MKITKIYNTVYAFATQRNATQRNANHNYILNNNFKFYISQFISFIKEKQNLCSFFYREKRTKKAPSFVKRSKTTPFRIRNSLVKTFLQYSESPSLRGVSRSNPNLVKFNFYNLISLINKFYTKWIATPSLRSARNDKFKIYNDNKNNFAILNNNVASDSACRWQAHCVMQGVRQRRPVGKTPCYLTSITFDSLSRKIKNPCLVINNLSQGGIQ